MFQAVTPSFRIYYGVSEDLLLCCSTETIDRTPPYHLKATRSPKTEVESTTIDDDDVVSETLIKPSLSASEILQPYFYLPFGGPGLNACPDRVFFFIPGNPGIGFAYQAWLAKLLTSLGPSSLIVFSGHLGHLETSQLANKEFTCQQNIEHQAKLIQRLYRLTPKAQWNIAGHSVGAYFCTHATLAAQVETPEFQPANVLLYCPTLTK